VEAVTQESLGHQDPGGNKDLLEGGVLLELGGQRVEGDLRGPMEPLGVQGDRGCRVGQAALVNRARMGGRAAPTVKTTSGRSVPPCLETVFLS